MSTDNQKPDITGIILEVKLPFMCEKMRKAGFDNLSWNQYIGKFHSCYHAVCNQCKENINWQSDKTSMTRTVSPTDWNYM